ncbi:SpoIIE family protein phosphatase [bacterium]|nr:SpoIIE family protein phosphatase [candidate division CSSED10-310 bacterium]
MLSVPWQKLWALLLGVTLIVISHYFVAGILFFATILFFLAIAFIGFAVSGIRLDSTDDPFPEIMSVMLPGALLVVIETLRHLFPNDAIRFGIAVTLSIPLSTIVVITCYRLMSAYKSRLGKSLFLFSLLIIFVYRDPRVPALTVLALMTATPFRWPGKLNARELRKIIILGLALVAGWAALFAISNDPALDTEQLSFMEAGMLSLGSTIFRVMIYSSLLYGMWRVIKPIHIRTRLRWAFLLNFFVPFTLLLALSICSVLFLVGGYNAAAAQRIIGQYGEEAAFQAKNLYDAFRGQATSPPAAVPFKRVAFIRLPDGTERSFGTISPEITRWLNHERRRQVEFIAVDNNGVWEFWVAGYHRDRQDAGAVLAYQVDETLLNRVRDTTGLELMLIKGQSFPWFDRWPDGPSIETDRLKNPELKKRMFNVGAAMFYEPSEEESIKLSATLRVLGTRDMLLKSLMMNRINRTGEEPAEVSRPVSLSFGTMTSDSIDLESINIFNAFLFIFLAGMLGVLAALVILSLSTSYLISRRINRSVKILKNGTTALDRGNLDYRIPIISSDELGELAVDFNQMAENLQKNSALRERLLMEQVERERLQESLETARLLQQSLLPQGNIDDHPALEVAAAFRPMETVGGDYYDYLWFRDDGIGLIIGDVSGHGMSAGLLMVMAKSCLVNQVRTSPGIRDVMSAINNMIIESFQSKRIMTFQYAVFTPDGSRMRFASAGHQFPYIYRVEDNSLEELESISYPLGVRHALNLDIREVSLVPGDSVILFTDGLVEAVNPEGEQMGYERLRDVFRGVARLAAHEAVDRVMQRIDRFRDGAGQVDDMTLVVVRRRLRTEPVAEDMYEL